MEDDLSPAQPPQADEVPEAYEASSSGQIKLPVSDGQSGAQLLLGLQQELSRIQRTMRLTLQAKLQVLSGQSLGSLELNRTVAKSIQDMLDQHGFRIRCHQCGHAAILRVSPRKGMQSGAFVFDHTIDGRRTFHGGTAEVPPIHLVARPPRKQSKKAS